MTLLAGFQLLLHHHTRQHDLAVGSPVANRNRSEIEGLIGFFVNTLVLRAELSGQASFRELLDRAREIALGAYAHQDLPFEKLVEELQPERNLSRQPLFQVMLVLQNAPEPGLELAGLTASSVEASSGTSRFDLTLILVERDDALHGWLEYSTELFDETTVRRFLDQYRLAPRGAGDGGGGPGRRRPAHPRGLRGTHRRCRGARLRSFLGESLPDYMVPAAVVFLDALPWTPGGKVDRKALPAPAPGAEARAESWVPPRSPLEEMVAGIWSEVLATAGSASQIGVHADFFERGGHSLLATQVTSRVGRVLGIEIGPRLLFEHPTVAEMAAELERLSAAERGAVQEPLVAVERLSCPTSPPWAGGYGSLEGSEEASDGRADDGTVMEGPGT